MIGWLIFYALSFFLLLTPKKVCSILYPIIFWIFVGFRDEIGTDYYATLAAVDRSYMPLSNFTDNFIGYGALDLEFLHKVISMFLATVQAPVDYYFVVLSGIESFIMGYILYHVKHPKRFVLYFICLFSINLAMNQMRQGLFLIFVLLAFYFINKNDENFRGNKFSSLFAQILAVSSHYGSIIISFIAFIRLKRIIEYIALGLVIFILFRLVNFDLLESRYGGAMGQYTTEGLGLRRYLFAGIYLLYNKIFLRQPFANPEVISLLLILFLIPIADPLLRIYNFYVYILFFRILFKIDNKKLGRNNTLILAIFPLIALSFEFFEIFRTPSSTMMGGAHWFPYTNRLI